MNNYTLVKNEEWKEVEINGEIKDIPIGWNVDTIGSSIKLNMGNTPKKELDNYSGDLPWITISNLTDKNIVKYTAKIKKAKNVKIFPKGTLLVSFKMSVGKAGFTTEDSAINEAIMGMKPNDTINNIDYLYYCLPNVFVSNAMPNGQGLLLLNQDKIKNLNYIIPPLSQQSSIASILCAQESIIQDVESIISKYESRFQYLSEELLSGRLRVKELDGQTILYKNADDNWKEVEVNGEMKEIPMDWKIEPIKELLETHFAGEFGKEKNVSEHNVNVISLHVFAKTLKNSKSLLERSYENKNLKKILQHGDILIEKSGGSTDFPVGRLFFFQEKGLYGCVNFIQCLRFKAVNKHFIYNLLQKKYKEGWTREISGQTTGISNLKIPALLDTELVLPLLLEQDFIASIFEEQHELINQQKRFLIKEKQKFDWLLDNLLSGKYLVQGQ